MKHRKLGYEDHTKGRFKYPLCILADNIVLSKNIAALFRLCDAQGVEHLYLAGDNTAPINPLSSKVSRFSERYVPHSTVTDAAQTVNQLKQQGYTVISLELTDRSTDIREFDFKPAEKICLILGSEAKGVNDQLLAASDHCIHIPMLGMNSSMNVICAAAIAVYEMTRHLSK